VCAVAVLFIVAAEIHFIEILVGSDGIAVQAKAIPVALVGARRHEPCGIGSNLLPFSRKSGVDVTRNKRHFGSHHVYFGKRG
jgi:hypothetical protein